MFIGNLVMWKMKMTKERFSIKCGITLNATKCGIHLCEYMKKLAMVIKDWGFQWIFLNIFLGFPHRLKQICIQVYNNRETL